MNDDQGIDRDLILQGAAVRKQLENFDRWPGMKPSMKAGRVHAERFVHEVSHPEPDAVVELVAGLAGLLFLSEDGARAHPSSPRHQKRVESDLRQFRDKAAEVTDGNPGSLEAWERMVHAIRRDVRKAVQAQD